jgi:hypothetical protein
MHQTIELTKNYVTDIIASGKAIHSELGQELIDRLGSELGIEVIACYFSSSAGVAEKEIKRSFLPFIAPKKERYVSRFAHLTVYVNSIIVPDSDESKEAIKCTFEQLLQDRGLEIYYPGELSPADSELPVEYSFVTMTESFIELALYHVLSNSTKAVGRNKTLAYYNARVYCGWDDKRKIMRHVIAVVLESHKADLIELARAGGLIEELFDTVKKFDKCGIMTKDIYAPRFVVWSDLSEEERFGLLRS